ncbi:hypothetical protein H5410_010751 [Solanum commersonii]|uniref:Uncharacterized protein n=1 Tax=Solanum commersonii TaxID=4109 RepID=A0A9J6ALL1_SOLCO|nr:hypothetical protein H5410_010751 [Solanum commersonii]
MDRVTRYLLLWDVAKVQRLDQSYNVMPNPHVCTTSALLFLADANSHIFHQSDVGENSEAIHMKNCQGVDSGSRLRELPSHDAVTPRAGGSETTLKSKGFRLSMTKTECLECKFSDATHEIGVEVRLDTHVIPKRRCSSVWGL